MTVSHYENRLVCGHRSWLSTTKPDDTYRCFPCGFDVQVSSRLVKGRAHPERAWRDAGKYEMGA